jgi:nucleoside-diphosphate-sugar epimerase
MSHDLFTEIRNDCLLASARQVEVRTALGFQHIAITGGTGFLGTWITEAIAALNDEYSLGITLDLYARNTKDWSKKYPHLANRHDVNVKSQDVRSPFTFNRNTNFVIHAAGIPNNRVHASDPLRVQQTTVTGINNALEAASQLDNLKRFLNVSSCLVSGVSNRLGALKENDYFPIPAGQLHTVYAESKRAAESIASIYRSQFRMPISTIRPFTFSGAYQELDRPWAINNFIRDILSNGEIRMHGDGTARRSYLYGSDAAWWTLAALVKGDNGVTYNLGSETPVSHLDLVTLIGGQAAFKPRILLNTLAPKEAKFDDLYPDTSFTKKSLDVTQTCTLEQTIEKTFRWFSVLRGSNN